jgi:hypothetical protein
MYICLMIENKQYTIPTKQAAKMFGIELNSFSNLYAPFLDRKKTGVKNFYNLDDLKEQLKKKRKWNRKT